MSGTLQEHLEDRTRVCISNNQNFSVPQAHPMGHSVMQLDIYFKQQTLLFLIQEVSLE